MHNDKMKEMGFRSACPHPQREAMVVGQHHSQSVEQATPLFQGSQ
jgi:hypothetical protein